MPENAKWSEIDRDAGSAEGAFAPVESIAGRLDAGVLLLCDHASNALPAAYGTLGLTPEDLSTHIAYDIGAAEMTRRLASVSVGAGAADPVFTPSHRCQSRRR